MNELAVSAPPTLKTLKTTDMIAQTILQQIGGKRFTAIDSHTAVITSEYNMECVKTWLERNTPIAEKTEF